MSMLDAMAGLWAYALIQVGASVTDPAPVLAGTVLAAVLTLVVAAGRLLRPGVGRSRPACAPVATLREHARRLRVPRQCDPAAAGHRRPRAPSTHLSVA